MMATVLACFYLSWLPFSIRSAIGWAYPADADVEWLNIFQEVALTVVFLNSCLNPIIYAGMNMTYRATFRKILHLN